MVLCSYFMFRNMVNRELLEMNKRGCVRTNVTLRRVRATTVAVEKQ